MKLLFLTLSLSVVVVAQEEFCWQACRMTLDGGLAACGLARCGTEAEMLEAERVARIERELFTREWSKSGKWGLDWKAQGNLILKK